MPASLGWAGANPTACSCGALGSVCQSLLVRITAWSEERTSVIEGFANGLEMPNCWSEGPVATIATVLLVDPPITKPPIITSLPVSTLARVEMFPRRGGPVGSTRVNAAVTVFGDVTFEIVQVAPEQSPLQPAKAKPTLAVAVQVVESPLGTGFGEQLTVPPFGGFALVVTVKVPGVEVKFAMTDFADVTFVRLQVEPVQLPLQPTKVNPEAGVAVQVELPPWLTGFGEQLTVPPAAGSTDVAIG